MGAGAYANELYSVAVLQDGPQPLAVPFHRTYTDDGLMSSPSIFEESRNSSTHTPTTSDRRSVNSLQPAVLHTSDIYRVVPIESMVLQYRGTIIRTLVWNELKIIHSLNYILH